MKGDIKLLCEKLEKEFDLITDERKQLLSEISQYVKSKIEQQITPQLNVICTHNSRRSHIGQLWVLIAAEHYNIPGIKSFSGGTEATALNPRVVTAMKQVGFTIDADDLEKTNPLYSIKWSEDMEPELAFSKVYSHDPNPTENFGAIMVCTSADEGCPIVKGADFRLALPFKDPKEFDDTPLENKAYVDKISEIGREILYSLSLVNPS